MKTRNRKATSTSEVSVASEDHEIPHLPSSSDQHDIPDDGTLDIFKKPHTVSLMIIAGIVLIYMGTNQPLDQVSSTKVGLLAVCCVFLLISALYLRDGPYIRPHPAFWRMVQGASIIYACILVFFFFQHADNARHLLTYIDPTLNVELEERDYADDCRIYTPEDPESSFRNIRDAFFDVYVIAHFLGWVGKVFRIGGFVIQISNSFFIAQLFLSQTLIFKDLYLAVISGTIFELMESSLMHWFPNFAECWWDKLLLDLFGANALGIICGYFIMKFFEVKRYDWIGWRKIGTVKGKMSRALLQITPRSWDAYSWEHFRDGRRFAYFLFLLFMTCVNEFNAFALKHALWIPSSNPLNVYRLILWFFISAVSFREVYQFVVDPKTKKLGSQAWLALGLNFLEILVWMKYLWKDDLWNTPTPPVVKWGWGIGGLVTLLWSVWYFPRKSKRLRNKNK